MKQVRRSAERPSLHGDRSARDVEDPRVRARARPPRRPARRSSGKAGTIRRWRRRSWARICAICARCSTNTTTRPASTVTSATAASTCGSTSISRREQGIRKYGEFVDRAADLVVCYGGSLSGEHGDGQSRGALLPKMFGDELMRRVPRVQVGLGSRPQDEPGQGRRRVSADREPPARRGLRAAAARHALRLSGRRRIVRAGDAPVRRPRRVPQARLRNDVPELHGDARGRAQHARPRAHAVRAAAGRGGGRRLEGRARQAVARPVPVLQGVQVGVPGQRRHGHLSRRVSLALLRRAIAAAPCVRVRDDRSLARARGHRAAARELRDRRPVAQPDRCAAPCTSRPSVSCRRWRR